MALVVYLAVITRTFILVIVKGQGQGVFLRRHHATPWYYWRETTRHSGVTAEGSRDNVAAKRLRDAVPALIPLDNSRKIRS